MGLERAESVAELPEDDLLQFRLIGLKGRRDVAKGARSVLGVRLAVAGVVVGQRQEGAFSALGLAFEGVDNGKQELHIQHLEVERTRTRLATRRLLRGKADGIFAPRIARRKWHRFGCPSPSAVCGSGGLRTD